jgi:hypothetical protein
MPTKTFTPALKLRTDGLNIDGYVEFELRPNPGDPNHPYQELVIRQREHGIEREHVALLMPDGYGGVTIRIHEQDGLKALVVNGSGQQYPAP